MSSVRAAGVTPVSHVNPAALRPAAIASTAPSAASERDRVDRAQAGGRDVTLLLAGGLVLGAALAAPAALGAAAVLVDGAAAVAETGAAAAESGAELGEAAGAAAPAARVGAYVTMLGRDFAAEYRAAAQRFTGVHYADPKGLGKALGAQAWTATEEAGRGAVVAAGLTAGAAAVHGAATAVHGAAEFVQAGASAVARAAAAVESDVAPQPGGKRP